MKNKDNESVRIAIEIFLIHRFDNINLSGSVVQIKEQGINYFGIDLTEVELEEEIGELHNSLAQYMTQWGKVNHEQLKDHYSMANLIIQYSAKDKEGSVQYYHENIKLFYLPKYYLNAREELRNKSTRRILRLWNRIFIRNIVIVAILTLICLVAGFKKMDADVEFADRVKTAFDYTNLASSIIASLLIGFLTSKVLNIRESKRDRALEIRTLSNKLTYFRSICWHFIHNYEFWDSERIKPSSDHAHHIKDAISYVEYRYPNIDNDIEYAKFKAYDNDKVSYHLVLLKLQLEMIGGSSFLHSGLSSTTYPSDYIYSGDEMDYFLYFVEGNEIWYCASESKELPETFRRSHATNEILKEIKRIYPEEEVEEYLTSKRLEQISLDFQYKVIPRLYRLVKLNEASLPRAIKYFKVTTILLLAFGLLIPSLMYIFLNQSEFYLMISTFIVVAIIAHILLSLGDLLRSEITLDRAKDYV